ncbi:MAG: hypothetical protein L0Y72_03640 [Gemmataceae bacterium]|nr:hypothetical protein [Gemmataceae bacterium]
MDILDLFTQLHEERQLTLAIVTHWEALADYATRVIRLRDGRIVEDQQKMNSARNQSSQFSQA